MMDDLYLNQEQFENIFKNHLKIETYSKSIESLFSLRNRNRIDYKPYYQRNYVWDLNKASYFIESIILGTEIPPLIFFNNGETTEIIDGRQRFETIQLFMDNNIKLKRKGLSALKHLDNYNYETLSDSIRDSFLDSTLRIIEFEIVNEPRLDLILQDKVKKEIFARYNSGITPLKRSEIDNAVYDNDDLTNIFKNNLKSNSELYQQISDCFFKDTKLTKNGVPIQNVMQFIRKNLVLQLIPITYYATSRKNEIFDRLYDQISDSQTNHDNVFKSFAQKINFVNQINLYASQIEKPLTRLFNECLLWAVQVLDNEQQDLFIFNDKDFQLEIIEYFTQNEDDFSDIDYAFYGKVTKRYNSILSLIELKTGLDLRIYQGATSESKDKIKELMKDDENPELLEQLESLRLNKPEPSRTSIEDIARIMNRRKFLVRPSYQRSEVINLPKASAIIESILLGIALPAIFVYKRNNGVSEVIDGQQRILTILSFIGGEYINEEGIPIKPKNHNFTLRTPKILKEFTGKRFNDLPDSAQEKILDFELFVVSIEEKLNPSFDPIDLFIRLNDKPYPIKEHSFEMWNSWADKEIITAIKCEVQKVRLWFYVRTSERKNFRDRMENEEIFTSLTYLSYKQKYEPKSKSLDIFQKEHRLNARIGYKKDVTQVLNESSSSENIKNNFIEAIKQTRSFINKIRLLSISQDNKDDDINNNLKHGLEELLSIKNSKRTFQDFYILWFIVSPINLEMIKKFRQEISTEIKKIMVFSKDIPESLSDGEGYKKFIEKVNDFQEKYKNNSRKLTLNDSEKKEMISEQNNICPISGTPLYWGDEIEVDHITPIALGGKDTRENLQIVHKDSNRKKGVRT